MLSKSTKSILIVCLLFSLLLSIFGCLTVSSTPNPNRLPIKDFDVTIDVNHFEELRAQLRAFADKYSLKYTEAFYNKDHTNFAVFLESDNFHIPIGNSIGNSQGFPGRFNLSFFNDATPPISQQAVDELTNDLKKFILEIPNAAIAERKKALIITLDENRDEEVLEQLEKFADKHSLDFKLSFLDSVKSVFRVEVYGDGFHIISGNRLETKNTEAIFMIFYTDINNKTPNTTPLSQEALDELFNDLKNFLEEIPDATVVETN